jgi:hypothetical protein
MLPVYSVMDVPGLYRTWRAPSPVFFVSVAFKGFSLAVSLLFATFAGRCISAADKELREEDIRKRRRKLDNAFALIEAHL